MMRLTLREWWTTGYRDAMDGWAMLELADPRKNQAYADGYRHGEQAKKDTYAAAQVDFNRMTEDGW